MDTIVLFYCPHLPRIIFKSLKNGKFILKQGNSIILRRVLFSPLIYPYVKL